VLEHFAFSFLSFALIKTICFGLREILTSQEIDQLRFEIDSADLKLTAQI